MTLLCVRLRLQRLVRRASDGRAVSLMAALCAKDREVREGTVDSTAAPMSVILPPHISRDSSFCSCLQRTRLQSAQRRCILCTAVWACNQLSAGAFCVQLSGLAIRSVLASRSVDATMSVLAVRFEALSMLVALYAERPL